eukprot:s4108_g7.t1
MWGQSDSQLHVCNLCRSFWACTQVAVELVGAHDPGGIFQHSPARQQQQIRLLLGALGLSQLTQLQGCVDNFTIDNFTSSSFRAMDAVAADVQFEVNFLFTWLLMLVGYGVYMSLDLGKCQGKFCP